MKSASFILLILLVSILGFAGCDSADSATDDDAAADDDAADDDSAADDDNDLADDDDDNNDDNDNDNNDSTPDDDTVTDDDDDDDDNDDNDDNNDDDNDNDNDDNNDDNDDNDNDDNNDDNDTTPINQALWTFVVYMAADNSLDAYGDQDLNEMKQIGSTDDVNIIVIYDGKQNNDSRYYKVNYHALEELASPGELNMGNPQTLKDGVGWAFDTYPAERYALILWDHGSGWHGDSAPRVTRNVCSDDSASGDDLTNDELIDAIEWLEANTPASRIDLIGFDACLMQMAEIQHYLRPYADVMVGSEETEGGPGWSYNNFLNYLIATPTMTPETLGQKIAEAFVAIPDSTQSAVDLSQLDALAQAVSNFADTLIAAGGTSNAKVTGALNNTLSFADYDYIDLYDFATQIISKNINANVNQAAAAVQTAVDNAVIWHGHGYNWYSAEHGISIYFPNPNWSYYDSDYDDLSWAQDTSWDELIAD